MGHKPKILIVEDVPDARELFTLILRNAGYDVVEAANGYEAVDQAQATLPDIILMDLGLPKFSGDEATQRIKGDLATKHIPIIICTAFMKHESIDRAVAAGAEAVLHKPIDVKGLVAVVQKYLSGETEQCPHSPLTTNPQHARCNAAW
jgi:CheY-like chemotaxis protein